MLSQGPHVVLLCFRSSFFRRKIGKGDFDSQNDTKLKNRKQFEPSMSWPFVDTPI